MESEKCMENQINAALLYSQREKNEEVKIKEDNGKTWPQYIAALTALLAVFNAGIHLGWPSPSIPKILSKEYPFNVTATEASYIAVIGPMGDIMGSILFPSFVDRIGRKSTILLIAVPQIISMWMIYFSWYTKVLLYTARFAGGISEAACFTILPIYIGEIAEPKVRGLLGSYLTLILFIGVLVINLVGSYLTIHKTALIFSFPPILFMVLFSQMPESPYYLLMKNKTIEAKKSLQKLRRKNNVDEEMVAITSAVRRQMAEPGRYKDLFTIKSNRRACFALAGIRTTQQLSGVSAMIVYMQVLLSETSFLRKDISSSIIFLLEIIANFLATFVVDRAGRKPLLIASSFGCLLVLFSMGVFFALKDFSSIDLERFNYIPVVGLMLFMIAWSLGLGGITNLMLGELFSANIKAKAACLMNIIFAVWMSCSTKIYQYTADNFGLCLPFFIYTFCQILGIVFIWWYVPETKGKTLEEIQMQLKGEKVKKCELLGDNGVKS